MEIRTNNIPRDILWAYQLTEKELAEFDYLDEESLADASFFRYKGNVYDLGEFMRCDDAGELSKWDGYSGQSYFHGVLVKYCSHFEQVIIGQYFC